MREPLSKLSHAVEAALEHARHTGDPADAASQAREINSVLLAGSRRAARIRAQAASRLRDERGLSQSGLASALGVTKGRAGQLIRSARAKSEDLTN